jgi:hypothetical protein
MPRSYGFGWGKGRPRVIKTIIRDDALTRALAKQQAFVDAQTPRETFEAQRTLLLHRRARAFELDTLKREHAALEKTRAFRLRMAKAGA